MINRLSGNKLKIIACLSMLSDHIGFLLFPQYKVLRYIGRLAMPIFSYLIAEGCIHTRSKTRYFLNIFALAIFCQVFYTAEDLLDGRFHTLYLNILFTFLMSLLLCFPITELQNNKKAILALIAGVVTTVFVCFYLKKLLPIRLIIDYGFAGVILPCFALLTKKPILNKIIFSVGTVFYCVMLQESVKYIWYSLLALPLIFLYNGKRGSKKLKYFFYAFYPLHLGAIYLIDILFFT